MRIQLLLFSFFSLCVFNSAMATSKSDTTSTTEAPKSAATAESTKEIIKSLFGTNQADINSAIDSFSTTKADELIKGVQNSFDGNSIPKFISRDLSGREGLIKSINIALTNALEAMVNAPNTSNTMSNDQWKAISPIQKIIMIVNNNKVPVVSGGLVTANDVTNFVNSPIMSNLIAVSKLTEQINAMEKEHPREIDYLQYKSNLRANFVTELLNAIKASPGAITDKKSYDDLFKANKTADKKPAFDFSAGIQYGTTFGGTKDTANTPEQQNDIAGAIFDYFSSPSNSQSWSKYCSTKTTGRGKDAVNTPDCEASAKILGTDSAKKICNDALTKAVKDTADTIVSGKLVYDPTMQSSINGISSFATIQSYNSTLNGPKGNDGVIAQINEYCKQIPSGGTTNIPICTSLTSQTQPATPSPEKAKTAEDKPGETKADEKK